MKKIFYMSEKQFNKTLKKIGTPEDMKKIVLWFLTKESMSSLKLTCLCYFAFAWGMVFFRIKIAPFSFFKKNNTLYEKTLYKVWKDGDMVYRTTLIPPELPNNIRDLLNVVWEKYGCMDEEELLNRIREQAPFIFTKEDILSNRLMLYFCMAIGK